MIWYLNVRTIKTLWLWSQILRIPSSSFKRSKAVLLLDSVMKSSTSTTLFAMPHLTNATLSSNLFLKLAPVKIAHILSQPWFLAFLELPSIPLKKDTSTLVSWLASQVNTQLNSFWESVDGEILEQKETGRSNLKYNSYNKTFSQLPQGN